jgi:hypothetical protein
MFPSDPIAERDPRAATLHATHPDSDAPVALAFAMDDGEVEDDTERQFEHRAARLLELPIAEELVL